MKLTTKLKKRKTPIVKIDTSLNKYDEVILFPDKLEKANQMLKKVGLPKQWTSAESRSQ
ncbi:MAG: hypothetical protein KF900_07480 [Bacteroidetes bacterium]|nr:hypothetical protein [Bacteroidota bacterium]